MGGGGGVGTILQGCSTHCERQEITHNKNNNMNNNNNTRKTYTPYTDIHTRGHKHTHTRTHNKLALRCLVSLTRRWARVPSTSGSLSTTLAWQSQRVERESRVSE